MIVSERANVKHSHDRISIGSGTQNSHLQCRPCGNALICAVRSLSDGGRVEKMSNTVLLWKSHSVCAYQRLMPQHARNMRSFVCRGRSLNGLRSCSLGRVHTYVPFGNNRICYAFSLSGSSPSLSWFSPAIDSPDDGGCHLYCSL